MILIHDVTNKILLLDLNYIVDGVMRPKFGNSSMSMREITITSFYEGLKKETIFFDGWS